MTDLPTLPRLRLQECCSQPLAPPNRAREYQVANTARLAERCLRHAVEESAAEPRDLTLPGAHQCTLRVHPKPEPNAEPTP